MSKCELKPTIKKRSRISTVADEKGMVLIGALGLVSIIALLAIVSVTSTFTEIKISNNYKTSVQAHYISEAGVHRSIGMLNASTDWIESLANPTINAFPGDNSLGDGTYVVKVFENDPTSGKVRINSTGNVSGSSSIVEVIVTRDHYEILDYATYNCGSLTLDGGTNVISGDVFVGGALELLPSGIHQIQDGDVYAEGAIKIEGDSSITGGNAFANGDIEVLSSASPNIGGNATAAGDVTGSGTVSGTTTTGAPNPVINGCSGTNLADITITSEEIQDFRDNADTTISGGYTFDSNDNYTGIVHITGNFELTGDATFSGNVIFIVDGDAEISGSLTSNPPGSTVTFLVPTNTLEVKGGGSVTVDGTLLVGATNQDGTQLTGGNIIIKEDSDLTVNGNLIALNGNTDTGSGGDLTVNYQSPVDPHLIGSDYTMTQWREVRN